MSALQEVTAFLEKTLDKMDAGRAYGYKDDDLRKILDQLGRLNPPEIFILPEPVNARLAVLLAYIVVFRADIVSSFGRARMEVGMDFGRELFDFIGQNQRAADLN